MSNSHSWSEFTTTIWVFSWQSNPEHLQIIAEHNHWGGPLLVERSWAINKPHRHTPHYQQWERERYRGMISVPAQIKNILVMLIEAEWDVVIMKHGVRGETSVYLYYFVERAERGEKYWAKKGQQPSLVCIIHVTINPQVGPVCQCIEAIKCDGWCEIEIERPNYVHLSKHLHSQQVWRGFHLLRRQTQKKWHNILSFLPQRGELERRKRGELRDSRSRAALHCHALGYRLWRKTERHFCPTL